jgi:methyl-accepting chemotaxis protein
MNSTPKSSIRKRMIFYFLLIALANLFVAGEIIFEMRSDTYRNEVLNQMYDIAENNEEPEIIFTILDDLIKKFSVMIVILIVVSAVILFLFVVQIASPLQYMITKARIMANGDLSQKVEIKTNDELADMGNLVNDLSTNLQEVIAQLENISDDMKNVANLHSLTIQKHKVLPVLFKVETEKIHRILQNMILLKSSFTLYRVNLNKHEDNHHE